MFIRKVLILENNMRSLQVECINYMLINNKARELYIRTL